MNNKDKFWSMHNSLLGSKKKNPSKTFNTAHSKFLFTNIRWRHFVSFFFPCGALLLWTWEFTSKIPNSMRESAHWHR